MSAKKIGSVVFALGLAGCVVNGKKMFGLGGSSGETTPSSSAGPAAAAPSGGGGDASPMPAVKAGPAPATYAWCKDVTETADNDLKEAMSDGFDHSLPAIAGTLCHPESDEEKAARNQLEARRQQWMKRLAMTETDWATDVVEWSNIRYSERNTPDVDPKQNIAWSKMGPVEQFALMSADTGMSNMFTLQEGAKTYIADAVVLSQAARLAYVRGCIYTRYETDINAVEWATCQADIDALDATKLGNELRAETGRTAYERMTIRRMLAEVQDKLPAHKERVKAAIAKDPAYGKMFEIAKATTKQWNEGAKARADVLALVAMLDDARASNSKKALDGCSEKVWPAFEQAVAKLGAKRFENIRDDRKNGVTFLENALGAVTTDIDGYLAANALVSCEGSYDYLTKNLASGIAYFNGFRGPRTSTISAIRMANLELDDRDAKISYPGSRLSLTIENKKSKADGYVSAVVGTVKVDGDLLKITFPHKTGTQEICVSSRKTSRISRVDDHGNVYYESQCLKYGTETFDDTPDPVTVDKRYAAGIKPGVYIQTTGGAVEGVWAKQNSTSPIAVFGVLLK